MDSYTITITPNDDNGNSTTLIVDTSGEQVRITDVRLHADGGLTGGQMPALDFGLLLKAVNPSSEAPTPIAAQAAPAPADVPAPEPALEDDTAAAAEVPPVTVTAPKPRRAKRTATAAPAPEPTARPAARRTRAAASTAGKDTTETAKRAGRGSSKARKQATKAAADASTDKAAADASTETGGRAYRRMPEDFSAVYQQAGTASAIADHYSVPRHTAQGWIRRLKSADTAAGN